MKSNLEDDIDTLFQLPLAEFTRARNALAARLKKEGRPNDAERVKLLSKPSVSSWAVNQLYWDHREEFDDLIATGKRFRASPSSRAAVKAANMRSSMDARREALVELSELATELLQDAGHNPSLDTIRRVTTTLEALSAYALLKDGPTPGRLTQDVDPPGFASLASLMSGGSGEIAEPARTKSIAGKSTTGSKATQAADARRLKEISQSKIADAKVLLQDAKKALTNARARSESLETAHRKANVEAREAERHRRETEERLRRATFAAEAATQRARTVNDELKKATQAFEDAKRSVEEATKELESLFRNRKIKS